MPSYGDNASIYSLIRLSNFLPTSLHHIRFDESSIEYVLLPDQMPFLDHDAYRCKESKRRNAFIVSSKDLKIYLYNNDLTLINNIDVSSIVKRYNFERS